MKFNLAIIFVAAQATTVFSTGLVAVRDEAATAITQAAAECGELGVLTFDPAELPAGATSADVRKCANPPLAHDRANILGGSMAPFPIAGRHPAPISFPEDNSGLVAKDSNACETAAPFGCSRNGYCWKVCADGGKWCWTAKLAGLGPWYTCKTYNDCNTGMACGRNCANPKQCGCGC